MPGLKADAVDLSAALIARPRRNLKLRMSTNVDFKVRKVTQRTFMANVPEPKPSFEQLLLTFTIFNENAPGCEHLNTHTHAAAVASLILTLILVRIAFTCGDFLFKTGELSSGVRQCSKITRLCSVQTQTCTSNISQRLSHALAPALRLVAV